MFFPGGFLADLRNVLQYWHDRGIRMFKFDLGDFSAATQEVEKIESPREISRRNQDAFRDALKNFREKGNSLQ